jgi:hypothetical protein
MAAKRSIMRIALDEGAKDRIEGICQRRGMTQISLVSRLVNWFSEQDDHIQTDVLQTVTGGSSSAFAKSLLKKLSSSPK